VRFQLDPNATAGLKSPDEDDALDAGETRRPAAAHREAALSALALLTDDDKALDALGAAVAAVGHRAPFVVVEERLRNALAELSDAAAELRSASERIEEDPERLEEVRRRRQLLRDLRRKYGDTLGEVMAFRDELHAQLEALESYEGRVASLEVERAARVPRSSARRRRRLRPAGRRPPGSRGRSAPARPRHGRACLRYTSARPTPVTR
jgi:DNA repair protein RecN (Recombination protein N)